MPLFRHDDQPDARCLDCGSADCEVPAARAEWQRYLAATKNSGGEEPTFSLLNSAFRRANDQCYARQRANNREEL